MSPASRRACGRGLAWGTDGGSVPWTAPCPSTPANGCYLDFRDARHEAIDRIRRRALEAGSEDILRDLEAELLRRLGRFDEARAAYARAIELATNEAEKRFLEAKLAEIHGMPEGEKKILGLSISRDLVRPSRERKE